MNKTDDGTAIVVPGFRLCKEIKLSAVSWRTALNRMPEAKNLVPANYSNLELDFQSAWREAKLNAITVGEEIKHAQQNIEEIKADIILEEIPRMLEELPKSANNADFRRAVMSKNEEYKQAVEHLNKLEAAQAHFESHMKIMENTSRFLKKQMDYIIKNGNYGR